MLTTGSVVGGYRIERVLGTGGMGAVYLAADPALPRQIALKVLSAELSRDPDFRARFVREADTAAALEHPHIVSVYNRGQTEDGQLWIAMQFVDGTDADAALREGTMSPARAVHIIAEVAKAIDFAHAHAVVHRDVKPANFLLSGPVGPAERVLLGDFGIARALDDAGLTATGSVMATVAYAAPEVLSNAPIDGRADIYSLGCTLYRLLTGKTPFPATNGAAAVMMGHLFSPPPRVTDAVPSLPGGLDRVIAIAMAKDPAARFPSAGALADAAGLTRITITSVTVTGDTATVAMTSQNEAVGTRAVTMPLKLEDGWKVCQL
ncbi:serine/threonine protein kinase [Mycobacterium bohemicum DSM 44277]|uniref:non-specific serine/threonine protein kinase n=1 Tax=Mycobacterium bohemicum DSM 44277 TaxID=1236609 RepID=A0A0U0W7A2_MYCBE|nr:serine/threonine protein kinase [Mycobacterium bohemicum DSM 44277]